MNVKSVIMIPKLSKYHHTGNHFHAMNENRMASMQPGRGVHGCGGSIASLLPYKNATKIFLPIFDFEKIFCTSIY
jgi:hypothetical protein